MYTDHENIMITARYRDWFISVPFTYRIWDSYDRYEGMCDQLQIYIVAKTSTELVKNILNGIVMLYRFWDEYDTEVLRNYLEKKGVVIEDARAIDAAFGVDSQVTDY